MVLLATGMVGMTTVYIHRGKLIDFITVEAFFGAMISHSILTLTIYTRWYPDQEISKTISVFYRVAEVSCWIILLFLLMSPIGLIFGQDHLKSSDYITASLSLMMFVLFLIQIIGGRRLVNTINRNAREQFDNSFV